MNALLKQFRIPLSLIAAVSIASLICVCAKQPEGIARSNLYDSGGSNWHPPAVTAMKDTAVKPNDSITITATGTDNGTVAKYVWAKNGMTYSDTTDSGCLKVAWPGLGRNVVRVKALDNDGIVSAPDSCVVIVTLDVPVPNAGQDTTVSINDLIQLHGRATDRLGYIASWAWDIGNTGTFTIMSGGDTAFLAPASENLNYLCVLRVTDDDGNIAKDTVRIIVLQDVPVVNVGNDTTASLNDTMPLHGSAVQQFGSIATWEWKIGSGNWTTTGGPDTTIIMPGTEQTVICSLAVTDDDGNRAVDGITIAVFNLVESVAAGVSHSLILKRDSTLWTCGRNYFGQLCDGTTTNRNTPVQVMSGVKSMAAGFEHSLILKSDGTLWVCGGNRLGQLGVGDTNDRPTPVQLMSGVKSVAAGSFHSFILKSDGTLWACGYNQYGQLGNGETTTYRSTPVQVMSGVQSADGGESFSQILKSDNTLWASGSNTWGQLGDGTTTYRSTPVWVMNNVKSVAAGGYHSLILKNDNSLWTCGYNIYGQLGDGTQTSQLTPVQLTGGVQSMAAGFAHSMILKSNGTLWMCGFNDYGQLGDGTTITRYTPVLVMNGVKSVAAGFYHSLILKSDGTLWACGFNGEGALGNGTTTNRITPVRVIPPQ